MSVEGIKCYGVMGRLAPESGRFAEVGREEAEPPGLSSANLSGHRTPQEINRNYV